LEDRCTDCRQTTCNPSYIYRNGEPTNLCAHCHAKYHHCYQHGCNSIGKSFKQCVKCKIYGCKEHMKMINGKQTCSKCIILRMEELYNIPQEQKHMEIMKKHIDRVTEIQENVKHQKYMKEHYFNETKKMERKIKELQKQLEEESDKKESYKIKYKLLKHEKKAMYC